MTSERWQRVQELFDGAADLAPAARAAYLASACAGDGELRREVENLLRSDAAAGTFIEQAIRRGSDLLLAAEPEALEGRGMIGKYEIIGRIGEGGFGVVYKGRDAVLQRFVALKTCSSSDRQLRRRFFREGQIAAGLQHPNITTVHDLGIEGAIPYLVQELLDGEDLRHKIARREPLTLLQRLDVLAQVARGLAYAHLQGVLHRDVKPANIRVLPGGAVKIMDFGIAKLLHEVSDVTTQGQTLGTVGYLAPEQLRGGEVDRRTDVFSFGVLAYELLSGERPFKGSTFSEVSYRLLNEEPRQLRAMAAVPGAVADLVERCLAKDLERRCPDFAEVIGVLEPEIDALRSGSFAVPVPVPVPAATAVPVPASRGRWPRWPRWASVAGGAALALALTAMTVLGGWRLILGEKPPAPAAGLALGARRARLDLPAGSGSAPAVGAESAAARRPQPLAQPGRAPAEGKSGAGRGVPGDARATGSPSSAASSEARDAGEPRGRGSDDGSLPFEKAAKGPVGAQSGGAASGPPPSAVALPAGAAEGARPPSSGAPAEPGPVELEAGGAGGADTAATAPRPMVRGDLILPGSAGAAPPRLLSRPEPLYPDRARRRKAEADVLMLVLVDESGRVIRAIVKRTDDAKLGFNEAARQAALHATFAPAMRDGLAGKMWTELPFSFRFQG
jgi:TonB family protein